jgi:hypothetical protein
MTRSGVVAMMLAATPAAVAWTATSEHETPRNGPRNAPAAA